MIQELHKGICDLIFPPHCLLCRRYEPNYRNSFSLCFDCQGRVQLNIPPFCQKCSRHLKDQPDQPLCTECLKNSYHFDSAWAACIYDDTMRRLIHLLKYGGKTGLRHYFSDLICLFVDTYNINIKSYDLIIPIPLHAVRGRERGFNQAELIAREVALRYQIPCSTKALIRSKMTTNQAALTQKERWTNMRAAFKIRQSVRLSDKSILVMDDLMTTGATVCEAAQILKQAGAKKVDILTLAIAI